MEEQLLLFDDNSEVFGEKKMRAEEFRDSAGYFDEDDGGILVRCNPGDIWQLGEHRLMCGDSTELETVKKLMGGGVKLKQILYSLTRHTEQHNLPGTKNQTFLKCSTV